MSGLDQVVAATSAQGIAYHRLIPTANASSECSDAEVAD